MAGKPQSHLREPEGVEEGDEDESERGLLVDGDKCDDDQQVQSEEDGGETSLVDGHVLRVQLGTARAPDDEDDAHLHDGEKEESSEGDQVEVGEEPEEEDAGEAVQHRHQQVDRRQHHEGQQRRRQRISHQQAPQHLRPQHPLQHRQHDQRDRVRAALALHVARVHRLT